MADIVTKEQAISDAKDEMFASLSFYINQIVLVNNDTKNNFITASRSIDAIDDGLISLDLEDIAEKEKRKAAEKRIERYKEREFIMEQKPAPAMTGSVIDSETQKKGAIDFAKIAGLVGLLLIPQIRESILAVLDGIIRSVVGGEENIKKLKIAVGLIAGTLALLWSRGKIANIFNALYQIVNLALVTASAIGLIQDTADELELERKRLRKERESFEKEKSKAKKTGKAKAVVGAGAGAAAGKAVGEAAEVIAGPETQEIEVELPDRGEKKEEKKKQEAKKEETKSKYKQAAKKAGSAAKKLLKTIPIVGAVAGAAEVAYDTAGAIREAEETGKPVNVPEIVTDQVIQNATFGIFNLEKAREKVRQLKGEPSPAPATAPAQSTPAPAPAPAPATTGAALPAPAPAPAQAQEQAPIQFSVTVPPPPAAQPEQVPEVMPQLATSLPEAEAVAAQTIKQAVDESGANDIQLVKSETEKQKARREIDFASRMFEMEIEKGLSAIPEIRSIDTGMEVLQATGERALLKEATQTVGMFNLININNTKNIYTPEEDPLFSL